MKPIYMKRKITLKDKFNESFYYIGFSVTILGGIACFAIVLKWMFS